MGKATDNMESSRDLQQGSSGISSDSSSHTGEHGQSRFTFVLDNNQHALRTHAMRAHWQERRKRLQKDKSHHRPIRPLRSKSDPTAEEVALTFRSAGTRAAPIVVHTTNAPAFFYDDATAGDEVQYQLHGQETNNPNLSTELVIPQGIRAQVLSGLNHALSSSRLDPFEVFPVTLNATHHKLIHHCTVSSADTFPSTFRSYS